MKPLVLLISISQLRTGIFPVAAGSRIVGGSLSGAQMRR
jgi:hypothetical protein